MKKLTILFLLSALSLAGYSQALYNHSGTGWRQNYVKNDFRDSTFFEKQANFWSNILVNGSIGTTASRVTKIWTLGLESTNRPTFNGTGMMSVADSANGSGAPGLFVSGKYFNTNFALKSNIASPTFTGTPLAPTAAPGTNTTQIATTEFTVANTANMKTGIFNILDYGAITNDGISDAAAIQSAINAAKAFGGALDTEGGKVIIPSGVWYITVADTLKSGVEIKCEAGAWFYFPAHYAGKMWYGSGILANATIDGGYYWSPDPDYTFLYLVGTNLTTAYVAFNKFRNINVFRCHTGIFIETTGTGWVNANKFQNIFLNRPVIGLRTERGAGSSGLDANTFIDLEIQTNSTETTAGIDSLDGCYNKFINLVIWDVSELTGSDFTCKIKPNSYKNYIQGDGVMGVNYEDLGTENIVIDNGVFKIANSSVVTAKDTLTGVGQVASDHRVDDIEADLADTEELSDLAVMLADVKTFFVFAVGGGNAVDTLAITDSTILGSFYNGGAKTIVVDTLRAIMKHGEGLDTLAFNIAWTKNFEDSYDDPIAKLSSTQFNCGRTAGSPAVNTNRITGNFFTTFTEDEIPPGVTVYGWLPYHPADGLKRKPRYFEVSLIGHYK
jgi:hypothetical protein